MIISRTAVNVVIRRGNIMIDRKTLQANQNPNHRRRDPMESAPTPQGEFVVRHLKLPYDLVHQSTKSRTV